MRDRSVANLFVTLLCGLATARGQSQRLPAVGDQYPVFRGGTDYVRVDVVVTDRNDKPVTDLTAGDFTIFDRGTRQSITDFQAISVPIAQRATEAIRLAGSDLDVATNEFTSPNSRVWVLVVDDLHIVESEIVQVKRVLTHCAQAFSADDEVAVVFVGRSDLGVNFTRDSGRVLNAIAKVRDAVGFGHDASGRSPTIAADARATADVLRNIAVSLQASARVRRAILYIGDQPTLDPFSLDGSTYLDQLKVAFDAARRSDVAIYTLDPRGGVTAEEAIRGGIGAISDSDARAKIAAQIGFQQDWLSTIAINTGGRAFIKRSNLAAAVDEMIAENSRFYLLGYDPQPPARDGKFHDIKVEVDRPGLRVRARQGYVASEPKGTDVPAIQNILETAMSAGVDVSALPLRVLATPLTTTARGMASVLLTVSVTYPASTDGSLAIRDRIHLETLALDPDGRVKGQNSRTMRFSGNAFETHDLMFSVSQILALPFGQLTLRVGAASELLGRAGTVQISVSAPKPSARGLQVSGIVLGLNTVAPQAALSEGMLPAFVEFEPTTSRVFESNDVLRVLVPLFGRSALSGATAQLTLDGERINRSQPMSVRELPCSGGFRCVAAEATMPLNQLPAGHYTLEITARLASGEAAAGRTALEIR
jgi:VWFA-related protein